MRIIKFRAWDKFNKKMYFSYSVDEDGTWCVDSEYSNECEDVDKKQLIQMQFTGLYDSTRWEELLKEERKKLVEVGKTKETWMGKEIYEGDIIIKEGWVGENKEIIYCGTVEWIYSAWQVIPHCINLSWKGISEGINEKLNKNENTEDVKTKWVVIGNIYENACLLDKKKTDFDEELKKMVKKICKRFKNMSSQEYTKRYNKIMKREEKNNNYLLSSYYSTLIFKNIKKKEEN